MLERDLGGKSDGKDVLEAVDQRVRGRGLGWVADLERNGSNVGGTGTELGEQDVGCDVKDRWWVDGTSFNDLQELDTVEERGDVHHVQELRFREADLVANRHNLGHVQDGNDTTNNLGWQVKSLEERGLLWAHAGWTVRDHDVDWGDDAGLGRGLNLVLGEDVSDVAGVHVGEAETNVALDVLEHVGPDCFAPGLGHITKALSHQRVLTHEEFGSVSERVPDILHLLRPNVVDADDENLAELVSILLERLEVLLLPFLLAELYHFELWKAI